MSDQQPLEVQPVPIDEQINQLWQQILQNRIQNESEQLAKIFQSEEEFKKIKKQKKNKTMKDIQTDNPNSDELTELTNRVEALLKETKSLNLDHYKNINLYNNNKINRDKITLESQRIKTTNKVLMNLKSDFERKLQEKQDQYTEITEIEKQKRQELINSFSDQIQQIQSDIDTKGKLRAQKQHENELLKQKIKEVQEHVTQRDNLFKQELDKQEKDRDDREQKIEDQITSIAANMGGNGEMDTQIQSLNDEETLIDSHLNPYVQKTEEFQGLINITNQQFEFYQDEMKRLVLEKQKVEQQTYQLQNKCEKSDVYLAEKIDEHLKVQEEILKQNEQLKTLQNLLAQLESKLGQ